MNMGLREIVLTGTMALFVAGCANVNRTHVSKVDQEYFEAVPEANGYSVMILKNNNVPVQMIIGSASLVDYSTNKEDRWGVRFNNREKIDAFNIDFSNDSIKVFDIVQYIEGTPESLQNIANPDIVNKIYKSVSERK